MSKIKNKVVEWKVWVHVEGLDRAGDILEGDEYQEPMEAGCFTKRAAAHECQNLLAGAWKGYTVILLYPDDMNDTGHETYVDWSEKDDEESAIADVRAKAVAAQAPETVKDPADFALVGTFRGNQWMNRIED